MFNGYGLSVIEIVDITVNRDYSCHPCQIGPPPKLIIVIAKVCGTLDKIHRGISYEDV